MAGRVERTYGAIFKYVLTAINPFKKAVIKTECRIHQFINRQALKILENDHYVDACIFFSDYIKELNDGVVWADQDLKSAGHFYSVTKNRGLYGNRNALSLALEYYANALRYWRSKNVEKAMFYLGATVHLVQDMTVPQHADIRLLNDHRQYENYIRRTYMHIPEFSVHRGGYYMESIEEYIRCNARNAMIIYDRLRNIKDDEKRFYAISKFMLPLAQKTTAGCFMRFYRDIGTNPPPRKGKAMRRSAAYSKIK